MDKKTIDNISRNVRRLRKRADWNQTQLAARADVAQTLVSQLENQRVPAEEKKSPTIETLDKLAAAFGVPTWTLLIDADDAPPETLKALDAVVASYTHLPEQGQTEIQRVADAEARYASQRR